MRGVLLTRGHISIGRAVAVGVARKVRVGVVVVHARRIRVLFDQAH